jgi:hypothetical protein
VDKKHVRIVGHSKELVFPFGMKGPWKLYADRFIAAGFTIAELKPHSRITHLVAHSHSKEAMLEAIRSGVPLSNRVLIIWEPEMVDEKIRSKKIRNLYGTIIYASRLWVREIGEKYFDWPQSVANFSEISFEDWVKRENASVMIQANKYSMHRNEMYSLRRRVIKEFKNSPQSLALYGSHWNAGYVYNLRSWIASSRRVRAINWALSTFKDQVTKYPNYLGEIDNKHQINSKYRITVVIENSLDYVSEKLFDALSSGTYVVYLGPNLDHFDINGSKLNCSALDSRTIKEIILDFLAQSSLDQYEMMSAQRNSILKDIKKLDHNLVLSELAALTISSFEDY